MKLTTATLIATVASLAHGAPVQKSNHHRASLDCKKVGPEAHLMVDSWYLSNRLFFKMDDDYIPISYTTFGNSTKVQFFECKPPSDKYATPRKDHVVGQLRSVEKPDMCLTPDNVVHVVDGKLKPTGVGDTYLNLEPCKNGDDEALSLQWLELGLPKKDNCLFPLSQVAGSGDQIRSALQVGYDSTAVTLVPYGQGLEMALAANEKDKACYFDEM